MQDCWLNCDESGLDARAGRTMIAESLANEARVVSGAEVTKWEQVATTKWGAYVSDVERRAILYGHQVAGEPRRAFEIGCEGGRWSKMLSDFGWQMICSDINSQALAICQQ